MRHRPVLPNAEPRLVKRPIEIGGIEYPPGVVLFANAYLLHHDPAVYPRPYEFLPERFLEKPPGTYTWIPFGGGRRRCLGASFALLEMKVVLRAVFERCEVEPVARKGERTRRRGITLSPAGQATVLLRDRSRRAAVTVDPGVGSDVGSGVDRAETSAHDPDGLRVGVDQDVAAVEPRRRRAERAGAGEEVQAPVARAGRGLRPCGARCPRASASGSRSSRGRWSARSCATTRRSGSLPRAAFSAVDEPRRHVRLAVDRRRSRRSSAPGR